MAGCGGGGGKSAGMKGSAPQQMVTVKITQEGAPQAKPGNSCWLLPLSTLSADFSGSQWALNVASVGLACEQLSFAVSGPEHL